MHLVSHRCLSSCLSLSHLCLYLVRLLLMCLSSRSLVSPHTACLPLTIFSNTFCSIHRLPLTVCCVPLFILSHTLCDPFVDKQQAYYSTRRRQSRRQKQTSFAVSTFCFAALELCVAAQLLLLFFSSAFLQLYGGVFALNRYVCVGVVVFVLGVWMVDV